MIDHFPSSPGWASRGSESGVVVIRGLPYCWLRTAVRKGKETTGDGGEVRDPPGQSTPCESGSIREGWLSGPPGENGLPPPRGVDRDTLVVLAGPRKETADAFDLGVNALAGEALSPAQCSVSALYVKVGGVAALVNTNRLVGTHLLNLRRASCTQRLGPTCSGLLHSDGDPVRGDAAYAEHDRRAIAGGRVRGHLDVNLVEPNECGS